MVKMIFYRKAEEEIAALSQMAEQLNSKMATSELQSVDLDNLFSFLSDVQSSKGNQIIEEIGEKMDELVENLDEELETVIQQEIEKNARAELKAQTVDIQEGSQRINANNNKLGPPTLPEPTGPPPPPPPPPAIIPNGNSSSDNGEPIYESVLPREENGPTSPVTMNGNGTLMNGDIHGPHPPLPTGKIIKETQAGSPPPLVETRSTSLHHNQIPAQQQMNGHDQQQQLQMQQQQQQHQQMQQPAEREQRRKFRVERKLQELEDKKDVPEGENYHDIMEFAQNYFNSHERSPEGTIMATLTRKSRGKSMEYVPKYEMVTYYKGSTIPNSHIHMYDPDNVNVACSVFRVREI